MKIYVDSETLLLMKRVRQNDRSCHRNSHLIVDEAGRWVHLFTDDYPGVSDNHAIGKLPNEVLAKQARPSLLERVRNLREEVTKRSYVCCSYQDLAKLLVKVENALEQG